MRVSLCVSIALCFVLLPGVALARNQPPIADAGGDRTVSTDHTITLKGSATDPDGDPIVTWQWSLDSQPPRSDASLFPTWSAKPVFVADTVGEYIVSLTVFDGTDWGRPDTATITVVDNQPPVADAGGDQSTFTLEIIVLLGSATDPDGDEIVEWQWSVDSQPAGSYAVISPDWTATPTFFADTVGEYIVSLIVFDGTDWSEPDTVTITVVDNQPPVAVATADVVSGPAPLTVHFDGSGSYDPEGGPLSYDWYFGDGVGGSPELSPTYVYKNPGTYEAELLVRDERDQGGIDSVTITVTSPENQPPVADAGGDRSIIKNETATLVGSATDPDGDEIVEWQWSLDSQPPGSFVDLSPTWSSATTFSADMAGDYIVSLIVFDGTDWSLPDTITITVADNQPPVAVVTADVVTGPVPLTVHFDGSGSYDPEGRELTFGWNFGDGRGNSMEVSPTHIYDLPGSYVARLIVRDDHAQAGTDTVTITVLPPDPGGPSEQACCFADGSCLDLTPEQCTAQGGTPQGEGTTCATTDCSEPPVRGLVAHYKLDETSGTIAHDSAGTNDGILHGNPVWVPGAIDGALALDGIDDYVDCGNSPVFDLTEQVTVAAWVKTDDSGNSDWNPYVTKGDAAYGLKHHRTNKIEFAIYTGTFHVAVFAVDSSFNGLWHHLAGTYDGSEVRLYIDGKLEVASPAAGSIATNTFNLNIGRTFEIPDWLYSGSIDDVRIYDYALSGDEIEQLVCTDPPPGDVNGDCEVDFLDLAIVMSNWLRCDLPVQELCGQ